MNCNVEYVLAWNIKNDNQQQLGKSTDVTSSSILPTFIKYVYSNTAE
jgi:hypothetical protein